MSSNMPDSSGVQHPPDVAWSGARRDLGGARTRAAQAMSQSSSVLVAPTAF